MALSFPGSPNVNQIHVDTTSGNVYQWNGAVWINFNTQNPKNIKELDNIAGSFNGSDTTFALTSGSYPITPVSDAQVIISIGGVVQEAGTDYTTSGSNITFTTAPDAALTFYGLVFGGKVQMSSVDDGSIYPYNFSTGGPTWDTAGNITITGIATIGTSSIVVNGSTNRVAIGSGATVSSDGITVGIITASEFYGNGSGLTGITAGIGTTGSINTTGIITATSFSGDGSGLTNIGGLLEPLVYSPGIGATGIAATTNIVLTYQKPIAANVGIVTIQTAELSYTQAITSPGAGLYGVAGNDREGDVSGNNVTVTVNVGDTLIFSNSVSGSHPLYIRVSDGGSSVSQGTLTGEGTATTTWDTFGVTPGTYYYQCSVHSAMIGQIVVQDNVSERFDVATVGSSSTISIDNATLTINPATDLGIAGTSYSVLFPENAIQDSFGTSDSVGISSYSFETAVGAALTSYEVWIAGGTGSGRLGLNNDIAYSSPVQLPGDWNAAGGWQSIQNNGNLILKSDRTLWGWGYRHAAANDDISYSSPRQIPGTQWDSPSSWNSSSAIKTDGTLWVWGDDTGGQLAQNTHSVARSSPIQIPGTQWGPVRTHGNEYIAAIKTDGTLWAMGNNTRGELGIVDRVNRSSPTQIPGTQWVLVRGMQRGCMGTKTDGTLWVWGENGAGEHGLNDRNVQRSSPTQIPGTQWDPYGLYPGIFSGGCLKTDGTLWVWGENDQGQFGVNDVIPRSSPVQLPGTWTQAPCGLYSRKLIKSNGTAWAMGYNTRGELGLNDKVRRSSPTQIPGTQWKFASRTYSMLILHKES